MYLDKQNDERHRVPSDSSRPDQGRFPWLCERPRNLKYFECGKEGLDNLYRYPSQREQEGTKYLCGWKTQSSRSSSQGNWLCKKGGLQ